MSKTLREKIDALDRFDIRYDPEVDGDYVPRSEVLRIVAEHETGPGPSGNPQCNFCDKRSRDVKHMVRNNSCHICDECIALCVEIQRDYDAQVEATASSKAD